MNISRQKILACATIISGVLFWFFVGDIVTSFRFEGFSDVYSFLSLTAYLTSLSLSLVLFESRSLFLWVVGLSLIPTFLFLSSAPWFGVFLIICMIGASRSFAVSKDEIENRLHFRISAPLRRGLPLLLTAFSFLIAGAYYVITGSNAYTISGEKILSRTTFNIVMKLGGSSILPRFFPGFNEYLTVDEFVLTMLRREGGSQFDNLSPEQQDLVLAEAKKQFFKDNKEPLVGSELLGDVFYEAVLAKSDEILHSYRRFIPLAFALGIFLFLRTVAIPYTWLLITCAWAIMRILLHYNLVELVKVPEMREDLHWK